MYMYMYMYTYVYVYIYIYICLCIYMDTYNIIIIIIIIIIVRHARLGDSTPAGGFAHIGSPPRPAVIIIIVMTREEPKKGYIVRGSHWAKGRWANIRIRI